MSFKKTKVMTVARILVELDSRDDFTSKIVIQRGPLSFPQPLTIVVFHSDALDAKKLDTLWRIIIFLAIINVG
jgi:hypothetical protein